MNAPLSSAQRDALRNVSLEDKFTLEQGRVYLNGTQALVRLLLLQHQRDLAAGLNTAAFVSGYRGSPLGSVDQVLWRANAHLQRHNITFQPGVNEDLAATAVWGSQQVNLYPSAKYDGVFGMWYGKGPGVDRSGDVFKHANAAGTSRYGGVLVVAGDDHAAKSSTLPHQSDHVLKACGIPVFFPATLQEYLDLGLHAYAMSRYAGLWTGFKVVTDVVEASASVIVDPGRVEIHLPDDFILPAGGLNIRWPDTPLEQEARLMDVKWYAALAYIRANHLNYSVWDAPNARFGIIASGKAYLDTRQALEDLGLDCHACAQLGIRLFKVGVVWPLDAYHVREFATGLQEILVIEEKRQIIEYQLKEELYNWREDVRPRVFGKFDEKKGGEWAVPHGNWLLPAKYELSPAIVARALAVRLANFGLPQDVKARIDARIAQIEAKEQALSKPRVSIERSPFFCSGCPHNTSTHVPEGSRALAGIGCHYMSLWMPERHTSTFTQMGGEGASWIGQAPFTNERHVFANLGDGTYFHSGYLAIRAAVSAKVNITYKILFNDAVAMTGGQPVDGSLTVPRVCAQVLAEGVSRVVVVTDEPKKYGAVALPAGTHVYDRHELDRIQRELREVQGVSVLIYDQTCAAEKRRRRKRIVEGKPGFPDPAKRAFIHELVCEGCGDCSLTSNCLSVEPIETEFGRKRRINQSSCNKDYSCVDGFCPSFVMVEGGRMKKGHASSVGDLERLFDLPEPALEEPLSPYGILVAGIGGTGVVTIGQWLGMAAHLEGRGVSVLDMAGLAQKGGEVFSHVQIAVNAESLYATRIATSEADLVIGCDLVVSASRESISKMLYGRTRAVVNTAQSPTADFVRNPNWQFPGTDMQADIRAAAGESCAFVDAHRLTVALLGDALYSNPFLLGFAWQKGWLPLRAESLGRAMELNGVAVDANKAAFLWGRRTAHDPEAVRRIAFSPDVVKIEPVSSNLEELIARRVQFLGAYQNRSYAKRYRTLVEAVRQVEDRLGSSRLTQAVARYYFKLMAYKDEYEVARLYSAPAFMDEVRAQFEGDFKLKFSLAPPLFSRRDAQGHLVKRPFGPWTMHAFWVLAKFKGLRGTPLDVFGYTPERKSERGLIKTYEETIRRMLGALDAQNLEAAVAVASIPEEIRGYGHIKEASIHAANEKKERLLAAFLKPQTLSVTARAA